MDTEASDLEAAPHTNNRPKFTWKHSNQPWQTRHHLGTKSLRSKRTEGKLGLHSGANRAQPKYSVGSNQPISGVSAQRRAQRLQQGSGVGFSNQRLLWRERARKAERRPQRTLMHSRVSMSQTLMVLSHDPEKTCLDPTVSTRTLSS